MDIVDFLPKYPNIDESKYSVLNPYEEDFYEAIFKKKEFYELKLDRTEIFPKERGSLTKYQKTISRFMSSHTPYDRLLVVHQMGLGKCVLPDTEVIINDQSYQIKELWDLFKSSRVTIDNGGFWTKPKTVLMIDSIDLKNRLVYKKLINYIYRQFIVENVRKIIAEGGYSITTTKAHRILTKKGWKNRLEIGDYIAVNGDKKIKFVKIEKIEEYEYKGWVYDLEVNEYHNYLANNIFTHNTCSAIGAIEQVKESESTYNGALILAKGQGMLDNFTNELLFKCTAGQYIPENYNNLSDMEKSHRIKKKISYYQMKTFAKFAKKLGKMSDPDITSEYSNKIIVIDEVHNLRPQEEQGTVEIYKQFHRFLHLIHNCKVLFLSGTPMKDSPEEIASVTNLMIPLDQQLPTGEDFLNTFMIKEGDTYYINPDKRSELKDKLRGRVSFLREPESTIPKEFIGQSNIGSLKHFVVSPNKMSSFQTKGYKKARDKDKTGKRGVYINSREASLFVFPDGTYGKEGFNKYIKEVKVKKMEKGKDVYVISQYKMSDELISVLKGRDDNETLGNIKKHSATYAQVIEQIMNTSGNCFIYSSLAKGSGGILFSLLLELFGFSRAKGKEKEEGLRYAILTNKTASFTDLRKIQNRFNSKDNVNGKFIKVIIGSRAISEGFSFNNVIFESINTPHWNYSETAQAIARGTRLGSHNYLLEQGIKPVVRILQPVSMPKDNTQSIDLYLYEISEDKDISIRSILRLLMENAFDCALNYMRNYVDGIDYSRDCDYTTCSYKCDGIDMNMIENGLDENELDFSTYQLYYSSPKIPIIRRKIEKLFREKKILTLDDIIKNLNKEFSEEEIKNVLYLIQEETQTEEFDYNTFLRLYSKTPVQNIIYELEKMFRDSFSYSFESILEKFKTYTVFEVLTALHSVINDNMVIFNKYGLPCYLREEKDTYFLVNSLSIKSNYNTVYYVKNPQIITGRSFSSIMNRVYSLSLPNIVEKISKTDSMKDFTKLIKTLPISIQELFIESAIVAEDKKIKNKSDIRKMVLELFKSYIKKVEDVWISTFLQDEKILRCNKVNANVSEWKNCESKYTQLVQQLESKRREQLREDNPYEIMGKFNPENGSFCIVDFRREKEAKEKLKGKGKKGAEDMRLSYSGKVCDAGGWKINELIDIVVNRVKINPPKDFKKFDTEKSMIEKIQKDKKLSVLLPENPDKDSLRRLMYWGLPKKDGGNRGADSICTALKKWFEENGLLEVDNLCGVRGKKIVTEQKEEKKTGRVFRVETFIPSKDKDRFFAYSKEITKLMDQCFKIKKYKAPIDENTWILVFSKKKLVGFIMVDKDNILWNVCVATNYRRQGVATQAIKMAVQYICKLRGKAPSLYVDNNDSQVKKLIRMYTSFGFEITRSDNKYTYMEYSCE